MATLPRYLSVERLVAFRRADSAAEPLSDVAYHVELCVSEVAEEENRVAGHLAQTPQIERQDLAAGEESGNALTILEDDEPVHSQPLIRA